MKTKVLYVEDEPFLGKIVKESLESRQYEVRLIADGAEVMDFYDFFKPDICVLDVMLPNRDGFSLGRDIRRRNPQMPIIFLTAKTQTEDVVQGFESGGNDYLRKPFSVEELIVRMENLLRLFGGNSALSQSPEQQFSIGNFRFFPNRQEMWLQDQVRKLSHRENQLLLLLCERPHQPVSRKDIMEAVWGNDSFFNSRNLDVYITRLREYLRPDEQVQILTLKGVGYRLIW